MLLLDTSCIIVGSLSARRAWIEIWIIVQPNNNGIMSLSARRAWIEIIRHKSQNKLKEVALRKESVDRNNAVAVPIERPLVALRKESVDRNTIIGYVMHNSRLVALRKESVDRNHMA